MPFSLKRLLYFSELMSKSRKSHFNLESKRQLSRRSSCGALCVPYTSFFPFVSSARSAAAVFASASWLLPLCLRLFREWAMRESGSFHVQRSLFSLIRVLFAQVLLLFGLHVRSFSLAWRRSCEQKLRVYLISRLRMLVGWVNFCLLFVVFVLLGCHPHIR